VTKSWHMLPIGFLFGLGFDTASEVALFGISATQAADGVSLGTILVFPALFTAGMSLLDTTDGVLMLGAYGWAFMKPIRKLYYNMTITAVSVVVAVVIGGLETLNLIGDQLGLTDGGGFWGAIGAINDNFGVLGYVIIGIFLLSWVGSVAFYKFKRARIHPHCAPQYSAEHTACRRLDNQDAQGGRQFPKLTPTVAACVSSVASCSIIAGANPQQWRFFQERIEFSKIDP